MVSSELLVNSCSVGSVVNVEVFGTHKISAAVIQNYLFGKKTRIWKASPNSYFYDDHANNYEINAYVLDSLMVKLPTQIRIESSSIPGQKLGVFSSTWIKKGTKMGPYTGKLVMTNNCTQYVNSSYMWEIFDENGEVSHLIDGLEELDRNWMCYIQCARKDQEQNLEVVQHDDDTIFYYALKDIPPNQELLVWYGIAVDLFLGIPQFGLPVTSKLRHSFAKENEKKIGEASSVTRLHCTVCRRGFNSRSNLRSHMRTHTLERPFHCIYCKKAFSQSSTLRNHVRLHTGERPYNCLICKMAYSQLAGLKAHQKSARHRPQETPPYKLRRGYTIARNRIRSTRFGLQSASHIGA